MSEFEMTNAEAERAATDSFDNEALGIDLDAEYGLMEADDAYGADHESIDDLIGSLWA